MAKAQVERDKPIVEELHFKSESAFLCLLLNRRVGSIRVIDFRSGALPAKRLFIQSVAKREGAQKVILLVEKDEVSSWTRVGFVREGTVPGFYKRSDGHLCGCVINDRTASLDLSDGAQRLTERTLNHAKKNAKEIPDAIEGITTTPIDAAVALKARDDIWKKGGGLHPFDDFGRDAKRIFLESKDKSGRSNYLSAEIQDCFGHSLIEIAKDPEDDSDVLSIVAGLRYFTEVLIERGIVSAFAFAPNSSVALATAFTAAGYRKTGLLAAGISVAGERHDAILWTRKLANPVEEEK